MDHYLFMARSITHAQQMARAMERAGVYVSIRRVGGVSQHGCGYSLQVPERQYARATAALRGEGLRPVRVFRVSGGQRREVAL